MSYKNSILIIDDEPDLLNLISKLLRLEGYNIFNAATGSDGLKIFRKEEISVVLSDVRLPDISGLDLVARIKEINPLAEIILITAYGTIPDGVRAIKEGAFDYITKGDEDNKIVSVVQRAFEKVKMQSRIEQLEKKINRYKFENIIGTSIAIKDAIAVAERVSQTDTPVLLLGETGTGKEIFAQSIHNSGTREKFPFVEVNCAAINKDLLESEMFGYKAGAFTGAVKNKKGLFEEADGGTIFLDEIGEMDISLQAKLLHVLESNTFIKAGDTKPTTVDVRLIAATNRNLEEVVKQGGFRSDLFYRINVIKIELPPLRERKEDIPLIAEYFVGLLSKKLKKNITEISDSFLNILSNYPFPGNTRELRNVIERCLILTDGTVVTEKSLPSEFFKSTSISDDSHKLEDIEKKHIISVLQETDGNKTKAAEVLGIGLTTLYRKLQAYGLE